MKINITPEDVEEAYCKVKARELQKLVHQDIKSDDVKLILSQIKQFGEVYRDNASEWIAAEIFIKADFESKPTNPS